MKMKDMNINITINGVAEFYMLETEEQFIYDMSMFANLYVENYKKVTSLDEKYVNIYKVARSCVSWNDAFCDMYNVTQFPSNMWNYTNMKFADSIFSECRSMVECPIDMSNTKAKILYDAFYNCSNMINPPSLPKTAVNLQACFSGCSNMIKAVEIPEGAKNCVEMFLACEKIMEAPVIPSSVTNAKEMFDYCTNLRGEIYVYARNLTNLYEFVGNEEHSKTIYCYDNSNTMNNMKKYKESWWNAKIVAFNIINDMSELWNTSSDEWRSYENIPTELTLKNGIDTSNISNFSRSFLNGVSISELPVPFYNLHSAVNCESMFEECNSLINASMVKLGNNTKTIAKIFLNNRSLTDIPIIPNSVTNIDYAFAGCDSLSILPELPESIISMNYTFKNCMSHGEINYSIPNNVQYLIGTFDTDEWVMGDVYIHSNVVLDATDFMANHHDMTNIYVHEGTDTYNSFYKAMGNSTYNAEWNCYLKTF